MSEVRFVRKPARLVGWTALIVLVVSVAIVGLRYVSVSNTYSYCLSGSPFSEEKTSLTWSVSWLPFGLDCIYYERGTSSPAIHWFSDLGTPFVVAALVSVVVCIAAFAFARTSPNSKD
jgi:hypothetical protein